MDKTPNSEHDSGNDAADETIADPSTRARAPRGGAGPRTGRVERQLARRRRRERIIGILIAVLGVAVLVIAFVALRNPQRSATAAGTDTHQSTPQPSPSVSSSSSSTPSTSPSPSGASSSGTPSVTGSKPLIVLNQTTTPGLAQQAATRFERGGWRVTSSQDGYQNDVITTTAYYDPAVAGAKRAALALQRQFATIHRVAERFTQLPAGPVVVVLTTDYSA